MFSNMKPAEKRLLEACQKGEIPDSRNERPTEKTADNEIRGEFLRALILSNNQEIDENGTKYILKIDPKGIRFSGVYISGIFDFSFCRTEIPFSFINSVFENEIILNDSKIKILYLNGSQVNGVNAQGLFCQSQIFINNVKSIREINFISAQIDGSLICSNSKFTRVLDKSYEGKSYLVRDGKFKNKEMITLNLNSAKINGNVFFGENFCISGDLDFSASKIRKISISKKIRIKGNLLFGLMTVDTINISNISFDEKYLKKLGLDGLSYNHLSGTNLDSKTLLQWLGKMPEFKPQPYKQLAKVLRNMGHHKEANDIMIEYNDIITEKSDNKFIKLLKRIYGTTAGYGYKPMRVIKWMTIVWLLCSLFYWNASKVAVFAPNNPLVFQKKDYYECHVEENGTSWSDVFNWEKYNSSNNWIDSKLEGEYTTFNPFWYSLDVILPIVDLQVEKDWAQYVPSNDWTLNDFTRWLMWFEILFGWIYSLILVAILSGLAKNEKD